MCLSAATSRGSEKLRYPDAMTRQRYPSDVTDAHWALIAPHLPPPCDIGGPRTTDLRELCNAIFYVLREGCRWRALPHDFGSTWQTVYWYFRRWNRDGTLDGLHAALRERVWKKAGKEPTPSALIIDSQAVKTMLKGGHTAMMPGSKSTSVSALSSSTPSGCCG